MRKFSSEFLTIEKRILRDIADNIEEQAVILYKLRNFSYSVPAEDAISTLEMQIHALREISK